MESGIYGSVCPEEPSASLTAGRLLILEISHLSTPLISDTIHLSLQHSLLLFSSHYEHMTY